MKIHSKFTGEILVEGEGWKDCLERTKNLAGADLIEANLSKVDLSETNLAGADLCRADLSNSNLSKANLSSANLYRANISWADLHGADLSTANLGNASLQMANLTEADLSGAELRRADLSRADLSGTCLDPTNQIPDLDWPGYRLGNLILGYRTKNQPYQGGPSYEPGVYSAPWFSTSQETECHPGLHLRNFEIEGDIQVVALATETIQARSKYRTKRFVVIERG